MLFLKDIFGFEADFSFCDGQAVKAMLAHGL
jgi:hypothetical protein